MLSFNLAYARETKPLSYTGKITSVHEEVHSDCKSVIIVLQHGNEFKFIYDHHYTGAKALTPHIGKTVSITYTDTIMGDYVDCGTGILTIQEVKNVKSSK